jgi:hypothetical protein
MEGRLSRWGEWGIDLLMERCGRYLPNSKEHRLKSVPLKADAENTSAEVKGTQTP